jgi:phospholipid transport system substrate-binding protein
VDAQARLASGTKVNVEFLVSDKSGSTRVFNIFVEGVNLLLTERTEVGALLEARGGSIAQLTKDLPTL